MPSLFLGKIGQGENLYEIHALTKNTGFREYSASSIADESLYTKMLEGRYRLLCNGQTIYCTAINPDHFKQIEYNPHDDRDGTIHIVSINLGGEIEAALSIAVDIGDQHQGSRIGLPLENRYCMNGYPAGGSLDSFRERYIRLHRNEDREVLPFELAEFYRHYKRLGDNNHLARIGLYCACYHLLYREAIKKDRTPTTLLAFDAILQYYNQYRYTGAFLRDFAISDTPCIMSPSRKRITYAKTALLLDGKPISRNVLVPFPVRENGKFSLEKREIPFIDGLVDFVMLQNAIDEDYLKLDSFQPIGLESEDRRLFTDTIKIIMRRAVLSNVLIMDLPLSDMTWEFSELGL